MAEEYTISIPVTMAKSESSSSSAVTYYPSQFMAFFEKVPPKGWAVRDGKVLENANEDYPKLWTYLLQPENSWKCLPLGDEENPAEGTWNYMSQQAGKRGGVPYFVIDTGNRTIKLPDTRGDSLFEAGQEDVQVGDWQEDAIRNIQAGGFILRGEGNMGAISTEGYLSINLSGNNLGLKYLPGNNTNKPDVFDASRVVPTASQNRPRRFAMLGCVYLGN